MATKKAAKKAAEEGTREEGRKEGREEEVRGSTNPKRQHSRGTLKASPSVFMR